LKYKPVIVIAIDDHKNLHKIAKFYRTNKSYSWKDEKAKRPLFVDTLGPFLYFEKEVPEELQLPLWQYGQIKFDKLELYKKSYVDSLKIPTVRLNSLIRDNCISCHKISGLGGNAHHINAINLTKEPGYALPLGDYTKTVKQTFLFDQTRVALEIGVNPNPVHEDTAQELLDYLY
jgi:hypothetical protein